MQSFIMNSHEVFIHIHQGCFTGTGAIVRLPQCQWSKPDGYGKISQCLTTTKHSKAKTVCIFLGIYCKYITCPVQCGVKLLIRSQTSTDVITYPCWEAMLVKDPNPSPPPRKYYRKALIVEPTPNWHISVYINKRYLQFGQVFGSTGSRPFRCVFR